MAWLNARAVAPSETPIDASMPVILATWRTGTGRSGVGAWSFTTPRAASPGGAGGAGAGGAGGAGAVGAGGAGGAGTAGSGGAGAGGTGATGARGTRGVGTVAGGTGGDGAAGPGGARTSGAGATRASGAAGTGGARGAGGTAGAGGTGAGGASVVGAGGAGPANDTGTHVMALRPSSVPQRVALLSPPPSSFPDPEFDLTRAASSTVIRLLTTVVTDPGFESTTAFSLFTALVDFCC
ncbi:unnamed protein product [Closterium sp. NIES-54]